MECRNPISRPSPNASLWEKVGGGGGGGGVSVLHCCNSSITTSYKYSHSDHGCLPDPPRTHSPSLPSCQTPSDRRAHRPEIATGRSQCGFKNVSPLLDSIIQHPKHSDATGERNQNKQRSADIIWKKEELVDTKRFCVLSSCWLS